MYTPCYPQLNQEIKHFHHSRKLYFAHFYSNSILPSCPEATTKPFYHYCLVHTVLKLHIKIIMYYVLFCIWFLKCHINRIRCYVLLCMWLLLCNMLFVTCIHVATWINNLSFLFCNF